MKLRVAWAVALVARETYSSKCVPVYLICLRLTIDLHFTLTAESILFCQCT